MYSLSLIFIRIVVIKPRVSSTSRLALGAGLVQVGIDTQGHDIVHDGNAALINLVKERRSGSTYVHAPT